MDGKVRSRASINALGGAEMDFVAPEDLALPGMLSSGMVFGDEVQTICSR